MKGQHTKSNERLHKVAQEGSDKQVRKVDKQIMTDLKLPMSEEEEGNDVDEGKVKKINQQTMTDPPANEEQGNDEADQNEVKFLYQFYSQYNAPYT